VAAAASAAPGQAIQSLPFLTAGGGPRQPGRQSHFATLPNQAGSLLERVRTVCILYTECGILNSVPEKIKGKVQENFIRGGRSAQPLENRHSAVLD